MGHSAGYTTVAVMISFYAVFHGVPAASREPRTEELWQIGMWVKNIEQMIKQFVKTAFCLNCRGCCRFTQKDSIWLPYFSDEDIQNLTKKNIPVPLMPAKKRIIPSYLLKEGVFICPFLSLENNKCRIYAIRPLECKLYPFLINRRGNKIFLAVHSYCPCIKENLKSKKITEYSLYLFNLLNSSRFQTILKNNEQIIHTYREVTDLIQLIT